MAVTLEAGGGVAGGGPEVVFLAQPFAALAEKGGIVIGAAVVGEVIGDHLAQIGGLGAVDEADVIGHVALPFDEPEHVADVVARGIRAAAAQQAEVGEVSVPVEEEVKLALTLDAGGGVGEWQVHAEKAGAVGVPVDRAGPVGVDVAGDRRGHGFLRTGRSFGARTGSKPCTSGGNEKFAAVHGGMISLAGGRGAGPRRGGGRGGLGRRRHEGRCRSRWRGRRRWRRIGRES
jgi:hypothetical protein